jgi:hypothetical protein
MANAMQFDFESILDAVRDCDPASLPGLVGALEHWCGRVARLRPLSHR